MPLTSYSSSAPWINSTRCLNGLLSLYSERTYSTLILINALFSSVASVSLYVIHYSASAFTVSKYNLMWRSIWNHYSFAHRFPLCTFNIYFTWLYCLQPTVLLVVILKMARKCGKINQNHSLQTDTRNRRTLEISYFENCTSTVYCTQSGAYWVTNNFIWTWLLLPFLPLSEVLKVHVATATR